MKLITLGKLEKKFFIYILSALILNILGQSMDIYFEKRPDDTMKNVIMINKIFDIVFYPFYGILEYILRKKSASKKKTKQENKDNNSNNKIYYLFNYQPKTINKNNFLFAVLFFLLYYIYSILCDIFIDSQKELKKLGTNEYYNALDIFYLYLIFTITYIF